MKKILFLFILSVGSVACSNQEITFPDFDYTTGYFPYQYPIRTLVLGDDIYDNMNDNNHKFLISAVMGGVYKNNTDRVFKFEVDNSLCEKATFASTGQPIYPLPKEYYTLSSPNELIIPAGEVNGNIAVQLTDAFFDDTLATKLAYVVPIRITEVMNLDSLLRGKSSIPQADRRIASHWEVVPKDFTMFAVKYVNPYHGNYFHRGRSTVKDASGQEIETTAYRQQHITSDEVWLLKTTAKNQVTASGVIRSSVMTGPLNLLLTFSGNNCVVSSAKGSAYTITGSGNFLDDASEWGNKKRDAIYLNYQFSDGTNTYSASDTLVVRDRGVVMEVYQPVVSR